MSSGSLQDWLQRLEQLHPIEIDLGLERVAAVAEQLGLLPVAQPVISVAGTNGKGSTVAVLEQLGLASGLRVGAYTSPHFQRFNERIRVAGNEVADQQICDAFERIEQVRGATSLTYFEFATLAALLVFAAEEVDVLVLEVGLGGRLDAVNIVDPSVAVITAIALDHQAWLGDTLAEIAREKAGIVRAGKPLVISDPSAPLTLLAAAQETDAYPVLRLGHEFSLAEGDEGWTCRLAGQSGRQVKFGPFAQSGLLPENITGALQAALLLGWRLDDAVVVDAVAQSAPTGRRQRLKMASREYVLDVAHNPAAVARLREFLRDNPVAGRTVAVFSVMSDKDAGEMFRAAEGVFDAWFLADQPTNPRAAAASELAAQLREAGGGMMSVNKNLRQALGRVRQITGEGDRIVVFGSFFTVAEVLPLLRRDSAEGVG